MYGGEDCYCLKYPRSIKNSGNPERLIGGRLNMEVCREECELASGKTWGYYGFADCYEIIQPERKLSQGSHQLMKNVERGLVNLQRYGGMHK